MTAPATPSPITDLLAGASDDVRELALALRALVRRLVPDAEEAVHAGWRSIGFSYDGRLATSICAILPHGRHVNLQFLRGTDLSDPDGRLEGTGKRGRHVKIRSLEELDDALAALVSESAALARTAQLRTA